MQGYDDTKSVDLVKFGARKFGQDPKTMMQMLEFMVRRGMICKITHDKLKPKATYFTISETGPFRHFSLEADRFPGIHYEKLRANPFAERIMTEAAELTMKEIREKSPDSKF